MSSSPSTSHPIRSGSPQARRPSGGRRPRLQWGWIEIVTLSIMVIPALSFLSFLTPVRMLLRVGQYGIGLVAWTGVLMSRQARRQPSFPSQPWAVFCGVWLFLQLFNPMGDLPVAAPAQFLLTLSILSPIFWAPRIATSYDRMDQMIKILFATSFASLILGFFQYYNPGVVDRDTYLPGRFDPPSVQIVQTQQDPGAWQSLMIERPDGRKVFRPFGLTDQPGGACVAASNCCLIAMVWILRRGSLGKRAFYIFVSLLSMAMLYLCQVRVIYLTTMGGLVLLGVSLFLRRDFRSFTTLMTMGLGIFAAALVWVVRNGGEEVLKRFAALISKSSTEVYADSRGRFLTSVFDTLMWEYPLGAGLGRWGMMNVYFGDRRSSLYSELQLSAWVFDGGIPLLIGYSVAAVLTIWYVFRISLRTRDSEFAKMACAIVGMASGILVSGFSGMPFISPMGLQFWLILGVAIGASAHQAQGRPASRPGRAPGWGRS